MLGVEGGELVEQRRQRQVDRFESRAWTGPPTRRGPSPATPRCSARQHVGPEPDGIVVRLVQRHPDDAARLGRVVRPLRQQRRLAPAGGRHHDAQPRAARCRAAGRAAAPAAPRPDGAAGSPASRRSAGPLDALTWRSWPLRRSPASVPGSPPRVTTVHGQGHRLPPGVDDRRVVRGHPPRHDPHADAPRSGGARREVARWWRSNSGWRRPSGSRATPGNATRTPGASTPASRVPALLAAAVWSRARLGGGR